VRFNGLKNMPELHITPEQQMEIARRLHPNAFDSQAAMQHMQAQVGDTLRLGHESIPHADLAHQIENLTSREHGLDHHAVANIIQEVTGITTLPPKH